MDAYFVTCIIAGIVINVVMVRFGAWFGLGIHLPLKKASTIALWQALGLFALWMIFLSLSQATSGQFQHAWLQPIAAFILCSVIDGYMITPSDDRNSIGFGKGLIVEALAKIGLGVIVFIFCVTFRLVWQTDLP